METLLLWLGRIAGIAGVALSALAVALRLGGNYWFAGFQVASLFLGGAVAMIFGCLCFAAFLAQKFKTSR